MATLHSTVAVVPATKNKNKKYQMDSINSTLLLVFSVEKLSRH